MPTRLPFEGRIIPTKPPFEGRIVPARPSFKTAWRDLNRRSMTLWLLFFGCIPGMFLLAYVVNDLLLPEEPFLVVTLAWMPATAWAGGKMANFICPRCTRAFFKDRHFFWPLRRSCAHCSLRRWTDDERPAAAG